MSETVLVGICECGNQFVVDDPENGSGCWACHKALHTDAIEISEFVRTDD